MVTESPAISGNEGPRGCRTGLLPHHAVSFIVQWYRSWLLPHHAVSFIVQWYRSGLLPHHAVSFIVQWCRSGLLRQQAVSFRFSGFKRFFDPALLAPMSDCHSSLYQNIPIHLRCSLNTYCTYNIAFFHNFSHMFHGFFLLLSVGNLITIVNVNF